MKRMASILALLVVSAFACQGQTAPTIYAESFRKGSTQVTEESFDTKLTPQEPNYRERIKDSHGTDRYELTLTPEGPEGDSRITAWRVKMRDLRHVIYSNVLLADQQPSEDPKNNLWWLTPNPFAPVPIKAKRIVKVDEFYVVMEVTNLHFTPLDSPYLDTMTVHFTFTNHDPRSAK